MANNFFGGLPQKDSLSLLAAVHNDQNIRSKHITDLGKGTNSQGLSLAQVNRTAVISLCDSSRPFIGI